MSSDSQYPNAYPEDTIYPVNKSDIPAHSHPKWDSHNPWLEQPNLFYNG